MRRLNLILLAIVLFLIFVKIVSYREAYTKPKIEVNYTSPGPSNATVEIIKNVRNVLFEQAHQDQHSIYQDYTEFASLFGKSGSYISSIDSERITSVKGVDILVLLTPNMTYSDKEIDTILGGVKGSMTLIIIGDRKIQDTLNRLSMNFGIIFNNDYIYDLENYFEFYKNPIINNFTSLNESVKHIAVYDGCSIDTFSPAVTVAFGGNSTKSSLGIAKRIGVIAVSSFGSGKIFAICDSDIFSNAHTKELDNENLARNLVNWS